MFTVSSGSGAPCRPHPIEKSCIFFRAAFKASIFSGIISTINPSSTMLDFADKPIDDFNAPLITIKLVPVTVSIEQLLPNIQINA